MCKRSEKSDVGIFRYGVTDERTDARTNERESLGLREIRFLETKNAKNGENNQFSLLFYLHYPLEISL